MDDSVLKNLIGENQHIQVDRIRANQAMDRAFHGSRRESIPEEVFFVILNLYSTFFHNSHIRSRL